MRRPTCAATVKLRCAAVFGAAGAVGALLGSSFGKQVNGDVLLLGFALLMLATALAILRDGGKKGDPAVKLTRANAAELLPRLLATGFGAGLLAGFFGIGGGFVIVPGLMFVAGMPILSAVGSSLVVIAAFGTVTAANYAASGLVDWGLAALFLLGGAIGGIAGTLAAVRLARSQRALSLAFSAGMVAVAFHTLVQAVTGLAASS
jgi:uncharacterized membrane protein YfcA